MAKEIRPEPYRLETLEMIKRFLQQKIAEGVARYYEIFVDDLKVVDRTNELAKFDSHEEYIYPGTKQVKINIYTTSPTSPRVLHKYLFSLSEDEEKKNTPLEGLADMDTKISEKVNERVSLERERWDCDQVRKDLQSTKLKLTDAEEYIDTLQTQLEHYRSKKLHLGDVNLGELASVVVEGMIRRNPQMIAKLPGGEALAGVIEQDNKERQPTLSRKTETEGEASFIKKSAEESSSLTEEEKHYIKVIRQMEEHFDPQQLEKVMRIIQNLSENTSNIDPVAELLNIKVESSKNE